MALPQAPNGQKFIDPRFPNMGTNVPGSNPARDSVMRAMQGTPPAAQIGSQPNPYSKIQLGGKALPGSPMPANPYGKPAAPIGTLPVLNPLKVPGTQTLADAGGPQMGGAGVVKGANGGVHFWDGTQPSDLAPKMGPNSTQNLDAWKAREMGRRSPGMQSPGITGGGKSPVAAALAGTTSAPSQPTPMMRAIGGAGLPGNLPVPEANRRNMAMLAKQRDVLGDEGFHNAMTGGVGMALASGGNQHAMDMLRQQQTMQLPAATQAHVDLIKSVLPNATPEQVPHLLGSLESHLNGGVPGAGGQTQGAGAPSLADIMKPSLRMRLPDDIASKPIDQQFDAIHQWDTHNNSLPEGQRLSPIQRALELQRLKIDEPSIRSHAVDIAHPTTLAHIRDNVVGMFDSPGEAKRKNDRKAAAEKYLGPDFRPDPTGMGFIGRNRNTPKDSLPSQGTPKKPG